MTRRKHEDATLEKRKDENKRSKKEKKVVIRQHETRDGCSLCRKFISHFPNAFWVLDTFILPVYRLVFIVVCDCSHLLRSSGWVVLSSRAAWAWLAGSGNPHIQISSLLPFAVKPSSGVWST